MPRQTKPLRAPCRASQQIDLFAAGPRSTMPAWSVLPAQTQAALIALMTRLILDHADNDRRGSMMEAGHDL